MENILLKTRIANLNEEQQKAVFTIEGPVMVVAGPGTGKTETLGARIAYILEQQTDIEPSNILCLTYTNAGVVAMRKRLLEFIGPIAHKVQIHTFHSFCNQVIQENADYFEVNDSENISDLEQYEMIEKILDTLPANHLLFKKAGYYYAKQLLTFFGVMKSENWSREDIQTAVQEYLQDVQSREDFLYKRKTGEYQKGDLNVKKYQEVEEKMNKLLSAVELFPKYQKALSTKKMYDYADMILWVIQAFTENEIILSKYQEQYQYILVDEFQDTNGSQKKLIDLLCQYWEDPNIFVVGDDDQSIYRFQGANMRNILDFRNQYLTSLTVLSIDKNYRSSPPILALADHIITKNNERLTHEIDHFQKNIRSANPRFENQNDCISPRITEYYNSYHEELGIIKKLKAFQERNIPLSSVAVIYQNHKQVANILKICEQEKIPVRVKETQNILELPIIKNILLMLSYFEAETKNPFSGEHFLFQILFFPWISFSSSQISALALERRMGDEKFFKILLEKKEHPLWTTITELEKDYFSLSLVHFTEAVLSKTKLLDWVLSQSNGGFLMQAVSTLFDTIKTMLKKNPDMTLSILLQTFQRYTTHALSVPIQKIISETEGVHFITAHSSKGLEFEYVFLMGIDKEIWDKPRRNDGFSYPDTLTKSNDGDFLEEKRRLFFVAITRAKKFLEISYAAKKEDGKEKDSSVFISECQELLSPEIKEYPEEEILEYQKRLLSLEISEEKSIQEIDTALLEPLLENYRMSATHLNKFLTCPLAFYYENLLRIPSAMSSYATFGSAMHFSLEKYYKNNQQKETLIESFEEYMNKNRFAFSEVEYEKFLRHGKEILPKYYTEILLSKKNIEGLVEENIITAIDEIPVSGKLDRIEQIDLSSVRVIDYKTGNPENAKKKLEVPSEKNNFLGGEYWRQMVFYALLIENSPFKKWNMKEGVFDFVEPQDGNFIQKHFSISSEEKQIVKDQMKNVYGLIKNGMFVGCQKIDCEWCNR